MSNIAPPIENDKPPGEPTPALASLFQQLRTEADARPEYVQRWGAPWIYNVDPADDSIHAWRNELGRIAHKPLRISGATWRLLQSNRGDQPPRNPARRNAPEAVRSTSLDTVHKIMRRSEVDAANHPLNRGGKQGQTLVDRDDLDRRVVARVAKELRRRKFTRQAERIEGCGRILGVRHCLDCAHDQVVATRCGMWQLCPMCCRRRGRIQAAELTRHIELVPKKAGFAWRMITLPIKTNRDHLAAVRRIGKNFAQLWRSYLKRPGAAAFRSLEFGSLKGNVHLHCIYYGPYLEQAELSRRWHQVTGDSYVTDIRLIRGSGGISEVAKYAVKMFDCSAKKLVTFWEAIRGRHTTQRYGELRGLRSRPEAEYDLTCELCDSTRYHYTRVDPRGFLQHYQERGFP